MNNFTEELKEVKDYVITITNYFNNFKGEMTTSELENLIHIVANALDIDTDDFEISIIDWLTINDYIEDDKGEEVYIKIIDILNEVQRGVIVKKDCFYLAYGWFDDDEFIEDNEVLFEDIKECKEFKDKVVKSSNIEWWEIRKATTNCPIFNGTSDCYDTFEIIESGKLI